MSIVSDDDMRINTVLNGAGNYIALKSNTPSELEKLNLTWSEKSETDSRPIDTAVPHILPDSTSKTGDLIEEPLRTEPLGRCITQSDPLAETSNCITAGGELSEKDDSYVNINKTDSPKSEDIRFPKVTKNLCSLEEQLQGNEHLEQPILEKKETSESARVPMSPEDFAWHKKDEKHPPLTTIRLPEITDVGNAVFQALTVKSPTVSQRPVDDCELENKAMINELPGEADSLSDKPRSLCAPNMPALVSRHISRFVHTRDTGALVLTEKVDAQTSMYVCAEGSQSDSQCVIPEITDLTTVSETELTLKTKTTQAEQQENTISNRHSTEMENALRLSKQIPLPSVKPEATSQPNQEASGSSPSVCVTNTETGSNTLLSNLKLLTNRCQHFSQSYHPSATKEKVSSCTDTVAERQRHLQSLEDVDKPICNYSVVGVQTETVIIVDDDLYSKDGPYSVDKTRESILRTPTLTEGKVGQSKRVDSIAGDDLSTMPLISAVDTNTLHPAKFDITQKVSRKPSVVDTDKPSGLVLYELTQAAVSRNVDANSSVQGELSLHENDSSDCYDHHSDQDTLCNSTKIVSPEIEHGSLEMTDFLQVLQSADDFEILAEESSWTDKSGILQLKGGTKEPPRNADMTNGDGSKKPTVAGQRVRLAEKKRIANKNAHNNATEAEEKHESIHVSCTDDLTHFPSFSPKAH
ncbi:hypothetical protein FBUS_10180 [Fasciolopsis buskii]|uniref:Uncharacterized protein n=1 Tax=Fasciolopsis buskii TaxID=27845 RepID=A0A8E0RMQ6_9TREM|nr:hypothetical protein FBUS_10180 [Fasciolopsis buski]